MKVAQATVNETVYKIRTSDSVFVLVLYKTDRSNRDHNYVGYSLYDGTQTVFSGESLRIPRNQRPTGVWAAMTLLGILSDTEDHDDITDNQFEFIESQACEEISIMVSEFEEHRHNALVKV